jgi:hypothetical protein
LASLDCFSCARIPGDFGWNCCCGVQSIA